MVVEVIKPADPSKMLQLECANCGVTLRFVRNDIYQYSRTDYTGDSDTYNVVRCPDCKYMNNVKRDQYPLTTNPWPGKIIGSRGYLPSEETPK